MFDNKKHYHLHTQEIEGITQYFVRFVDSAGENRQTQVSRPVYLEFERFVRQERNLRRWDERYLEYSTLTDEDLLNRAIHIPKSVEEAVIDSLTNQKLREAILALSQMQRRRFILYYEFGLTYEQIAVIEGCSKVAVKYSIDNAKANIQKKFVSQA